jgi:two-component system phosphate regulon sensor histidine kinase PhoR/two-component system sensor histidine kinase VicK
MVLVLGTIWLTVTYLEISLWLAMLCGGAVALILMVLFALRTSTFVLAPTRALWQAVLHLMPQENGVAAPDVASLSVGRELVSSLTAQIYQLATNAEHLDAVNAKQTINAQATFIMNNLPLPLFILNAEQTITFVNDAACKYMGVEAADLVNQNIYSVLDMSFPNDQTFDKWLGDVQKNSATASKLWERVRLNVTDNQPTRLFDLAAYYNQGNTDHNETMLVIFDHTKSYSQDDQAVSFIALSVHELRTPLTMLRGYIEAFEEEFEGKLSPELADFMAKMSATAQQLSAFVNNILNVARVDGDQLVLELNEENWPEVVKSAVDTMALRARVRGIELVCKVAPDLPTVGVDRISIHEVINNLIDNAIKYSGKSTKIEIESYLNAEGMVETVVRDSGVGIPANIMANLFTKFYRDHRNRAQIGGTGLGLYLSKSIITAHGGNIWVKSKEGQGSTFGFTLLPYAKLTEGQKSGNAELVRGAHGWIKNHSLYRR